MNILTIIPIRPGLNPAIRAMSLAASAAMLDANPGHTINLLLDTWPEPSQAGDNTPWNRVGRVRNRVLSQINLSTYTHLLWLDADVIRYPADMPSRLLAANADGMTAPLVLVDHWGERFYDWAAFIERGTAHIERGNRWRIAGRNLQHDPPYWAEAPATELVEMDCVGTVTLVPTDIYRQGARYDPQEPAYTDHWPIAAACLARGRRVICHRGVVAYHANLPEYGEAWH
jgi:hypothetical protein